ncbi:mitochondrial mRNA pseudouridine synthase RPUSD3 isoform X2 [Phyllobates terribilis]|uniref:mitochondrial mRNA pseudouridine synthase RPUSD3 isoform X2 n=1 Tax=Phyllobates terribilis TaxID=111132 RepID=UPI003CCAF795
MTAVYRRVRSGWRTVSGIGGPGCARGRCSTPWYQEHLEMEAKGRRPPPRPQEVKSSILSCPGVPSVDSMTRESLCEHLAQNVVYMAGPLVAISKPQGLPITGNAEGNSVMSVLPELQRILQIKSELHVVKAAPKETSGLVLFSSCYVTTKKFEDFYSECRRSARPLATFWAVTLGVPNPSKGEIKVALKVEKIRDLDLVVPVMHPSKGSLERRDVKRTETRYQVLRSADGCSLLQLQPMSVYREQLLVHCSLQFCPVLGDHTYSSRVAKILGQNIFVPLDLATPRPQRIEETILRRMHVTEEQVHRIPLHLHLQLLLMPDDPSAAHPTHLTAPPPPYFQRTMELLRLKMK